MERETRERSSARPGEEQRRTTRRGKVWERTGFGDKTAWDWLQLLIVPAMLGFGALFFNEAQSTRQLETEERRARAQLEAEDERAQEERLQTYLGEIGTLLIDEDLLGSEENDEARYLARARTLAVLRRADGEQRRSVVEFLAESGLAGSRVPGTDVEPVISLANANLSEADLTLIDYLQGTDLTETDLSDATVLRINLSKAVLRRANLTEADLAGTILRQADLNEATLTTTNMQQVDLSGADLTGANLSAADLTDANLEDATGITVEELEEQTASLEGATMPDGTVHE